MKLINQTVNQGNCGIVFFCPNYLVFRFLTLPSRVTSGYLWLSWPSPPSRWKWNIDVMREKYFNFLSDCFLPPLYSFFKAFCNTIFTIYILSHCNCNYYTEKIQFQKSNPPIEVHHIQFYIWPRLVYKSPFFMWPYILIIEYYPEKISLVFFNRLFPWDRNIGPLTEIDRFLPWAHVILGTNLTFY